MHDQISNWNWLRIPAAAAFRSDSLGCSAVARGCDDLHRYRRQVSNTADMHRRWIEIWIVFQCRRQSAGHCAGQVSGLWRLFEPDHNINPNICFNFREFTYHLHLEAVNSLLVLLSVHLFSQQPTEKSVIFRYDPNPFFSSLRRQSTSPFHSNRTIYKNPNANTLMSALLHFVSRMVEAPQTMFGLHSGGGSLVFGIAESLLSIFTFRKNHQDFHNSTDLTGTYREQYPLANQSLLLILILTNHCTAKSNNNQYRLSLFGCCDSKGISPILRIHSSDAHSIDNCFSYRFAKGGCNI